MAATTVERKAPNAFMQGIAVPASSVRPDEFFEKTRRKIQLEKNLVYVGQAQDVVELRKSDILSNLHLRFLGQVVVTTPTGTCTTTSRWPYDFLRQVRFTANGASNIINVSGLKLKVRDMMKRDNLNDRGVAQTVGGTSRTQATLAMAHEAWGAGSNSVITAGTYPIDLDWIVPVAEDEIDLAGAIFLATSSSDLTLAIDYELPANLFTLTGTATATLTGTLQVTSTKFSIPMGSDGQIVVPNLNLFHSLVQTRVSAGLANGENELRIVGQGAGKSLLRLYYQFWNGAAPQSPLIMNATNYGKQAWRYGNNETPDEIFDGAALRAINERQFNSDIGSVWGFGCHEFAADSAFRDVVDQGTTSELRIVSNIQSGVTLVNAGAEYVAETVFAAGQAA